MTSMTCMTGTLASMRDTMDHRGVRDGKRTDREPAWVVFPMGTSEFAHPGLSHHGQEMRTLGAHLSGLVDADQSRFDQFTEPAHMKTDACLRYVAEHHDRWEMLLLVTDQPHHVGPDERGKDTVALLAPYRRYLDREFPRADCRSSAFTGTGPHLTGPVRPWLQEAVAAGWNERTFDGELPIVFVIARSGTPAIRDTCPVVVRDIVPPVSPVYTLDAVRGAGPTVRYQEPGAAPTGAGGLAALFTRAFDLDTGQVIAEVLAHHPGTDQTSTAILAAARALLDLAAGREPSGDDRRLVEALLDPTAPGLEWTSDEINDTLRGLLRSQMNRQ